jgi:hypothetical protein
MFIKLWSFSARWFLRQFRKKKHFENCNRHWTNEEYTHTCLCWKCLCWLTFSRM